MSLPVRWLWWVVLWRFWVDGGASCLTSVPCMGTWRSRPDVSVADKDVEMSASGLPFVFTVRMGAGFHHDALQSGALYHGVSGLRILYVQDGFHLGKHGIAWHSELDFALFWGNVCFLVFVLWDNRYGLGSQMHCLISLCGEQARSDADSTRLRLAMRIPRPF